MYKLTPQYIVSYDQVKYIFPTYSGRGRKGEGGREGGRGEGEVKVEGTVRRSFGSLI